jgi:catechol 2,3-dioxygenase
MATEPLDLDALMKELPDHDAPWGGMPAGTVIGHVHLRVTQIAPAEAFYRDVLGFDLTTRYGDAASFLSAGGYHHHIAVNTWASLGAPPPPDGAAGLAHFVVRLPDRTELDRVTERVSAAGVPALRIADGVLVRDPSGNGVLLSAPGA